MYLSRLKQVGAREVGRDRFLCINPFSIKAGGSNKHTNTIHIYNWIETKQQEAKPILSRKSCRHLVRTNPSRVSPSISYLQEQLAILCINNTDYSFLANALGKSFWFPLSLWYAVVYKETKSKITTVYHLILKMRPVKYSNHFANLKGFIFHWRSQLIFESKYQIRS